MKLREMERMLIQNGFVLIRSTKHRVYSNGKTQVIVPMHKEVNKYIAKKILQELKVA